MDTTAQKLKLVYLARIFETETDAEHGLTGPQLVAHLSECGVEIERKTLYRDIACLKEAGYDIRKYQRSKVEWGLASRDFQEGELLLLADAVQSSRFLTKRKADALTKSLTKLGSKHMAASLKKHVHVEGRIRTQNESVFYNVDTIQRAMDEGRKISFRYFKHDETKQRALQHDGMRYVETPVQLVYMDGCYYLVVWNDKHAGFANYRVDRMLSILVSEEPATRNERINRFDVARYQQRVFDMFNGKAVSVRLKVEASAMSPVIDKFGPDVLVTQAADGVATISVTVMESPTFYGWLTQFGGSVSIESPKACQERYVEHLRKLVTSYECEESPEESV